MITCPPVPQQLQGHERTSAALGYLGLLCLVRGVSSDEALGALEVEMRQVIERRRQFGQEGPLPAPQTLLDGVYVV